MKLSELALLALKRLGSVATEKEILNQIEKTAYCQPAHLTNTLDALEDYECIHSKAYIKNNAMNWHYILTPKGNELCQIILKRETA